MTDTKTLLDNISHADESQESGLLLEAAEIALARGWLSRFDYDTAFLKYWHADAYLDAAEVLRPVGWVGDSSTGSREELEEGCSAELWNRAFGNDCVEIRAIAASEPLARLSAAIQAREAMEAAEG